MLRDPVIAESTLISYVTHGAQGFLTALSQNLCEK